jgi:hypothetical protein
MSEYNPYGGMQPQQQPGGYQIPPSPGASQWGAGSPQQYPQQMYQDPNRPMSTGSGVSGNIAPLPMWVERAQAPSPGMSTTSATHSVPAQPPYQGGYQQQGGYPQGY